MKVFLKQWTLFILISILINGCKKIQNEPIEKNLAVPQKVTNLTVINQAGKAVITYVIPNDPNVFYVKAVYKASSGLPLEAKSSYFGDSLTVDGFADTLEHEISIYSVSRSNVTSDPVTIRVKPKIAPIWLVYNTLSVNTAFGGYDLKAVNTQKANISILVFKKNVFNEFEVDNTASVFTRTDSILSKVRGLDTLNYTFGFMIQDKWGNKTDTIFKNIKPFYEIELPKQNFRDFTLPGDAKQWNNGETKVQYMWDNQLDWPWTSFTDPGKSPPGPTMVTFDLGALAKLSRIKIIPYHEGSNYYYLTTLKRFEIYGSVQPSLDGQLDNTWKLLGSYTVVKQTGSPYGEDNDQDRAIASAGFNWDIDLSSPKVRYLRIRCIENFGGGYAQSVNELYIYGDPR